MFINTSDLDTWKYTSRLPIKHTMRARRNSVGHRITAVLILICNQESKSSN